MGKYIYMLSQHRTKNRQVKEEIGSVHQCKITYFAILEE